MQQITNPDVNSKSKATTQRQIVQKREEKNPQFESLNSLSLEPEEVKKIQLRPNAQNFPIPTQQIPITNQQIIKSKFPEIENNKNNDFVRILDDSELKKQDENVESQLLNEHSFDKQQLYESKCIYVPNEQKSARQGQKSQVKGSQQTLELAASKDIIVSVQAPSPNFSLSNSSFAKQF